VGFGQIGIIKLQNYDATREVLGEQPFLKYGGR